MKLTHPAHEAPADADERRRRPPVICYPTATLPNRDLAQLEELRSNAAPSDRIVVPPRDARCAAVSKGCFFRITSIDGPQVGDLNLWNSANLDERFFSGKTRALHGTHLSTGDQLWSSFPYLRPLATVTTDTLDWYGFDQDGASVHDVIGTRCDPYTGKLLSGSDYHWCCHSNLTRALAEFADLPLREAEAHVHDVLNVFMCTGFTQDTHQYFMKPSPVRPGDFIEFFAETDLVVGLSACPGGDCGDEHSSDTAKCHPLQIDVFTPDKPLISSVDFAAPSAYDRSHGANS